MLGLCDDILREIVGYLDFPSRVCLTMTCTGIRSAVNRLAESGSLDTPKNSWAKNWLEECAGLDYLELLEMFGPADWTKAVHAAAASGSPRVLECGFSRGAAISRELILAGIRGKHVGNLRYIFSKTNKLTLNHFAMDVVAGEGLLWIPEDLLGGVYATLRIAYPTRVIAQCRSVATIRKLQENNVLPQKEYLDGSYFTASVICEMVLAGDFPRVKKPTVISAAVRSAHSRDITLEQYRRIIRATKERREDDTRVLLGRFDVVGSTISMFPGIPSGPTIQELFVIAYEEISKGSLEDNLALPIMTDVLFAADGSWEWLAACTTPEDLRACSQALQAVAHVQNNRPALDWLKGLKNE